MLLFCLRRLFFAYAVCMVSSTIVFQVAIIDFLSTFLLGYFISVQPMVDSLNNFIHIFNEIVVLIATQSMFLFTNYVDDPVIRYKFGFYFIYLIGFNIVMNLAVLVISLCKVFYGGIKSWLIKRSKKKVQADKDPTS